MAEWFDDMLGMPEPGASFWDWNNYFYFKMFPMCFLFGLLISLGTPAVWWTWLPDLSGRR
jgi:hypothetical protein